MTNDKSTKLLKQTYKENRYQDIGSVLLLSTKS